MPELPLVAFAATLALGVLVMALSIMTVLGRETAETYRPRLLLALGAFGVVSLASGAVVVAMVEFPEAPKTVRALYAHAIQVNDTDGAWGLVCQADRQGASRVVFDEGVKRTLADLGGRITDVRPTRGSYLWTGANGKRLYRLPETTGRSHPCIRLASNPLGNE